MSGLDPAEALDDDPDVERHHERDERLERHVDPELAVRLLERLGQHGAPFGIDAREALAQLRLVPGERLQLEPDLLVGDVLAHQVAHRRPPLLDERHVGRVQLALPRDQAFGEALERPDEQVLVRAEVVVDEPVVDAGLLREPSRRDARVADVDQQALGRVEQGLFGRRAGAVFVRCLHQRHLSDRSSRRPSSSGRRATTTAPVAAPSAASLEHGLLDGDPNDVRDDHWKISVVQSPPWRRTSCARAGPSGRSGKSTKKS